MSDFEEWFLSNGIPLDTDFNVAKIAFEAGQQSQQAKIDELQTRVDKTVNHIEEWYGCVELSNIVDMLKGNKDED